MNNGSELWLAVREDARFAVKSLARVKTYTMTVVLTLGLAIGGVTAVFSVLYAVVLRPLPFPAAHELVNVYGAFQAIGLNRVPSSPNEFLDICDKNHSFAKVAGYESGSLNLTGRSDAVRVASGFVTAEFFRVLGVTPSLGRDFAPGEDRLGAPDVVLLSSAFHRRVFGGAPDVIGKAVELDGKPSTIIGVVPPVLDEEHRIGDLKGDEGETRDLWVPLRFTAEQLEPRARGGRYIATIARLKCGVSLASAVPTCASSGSRSTTPFPFPTSARRCGE